MRALVKQETGYGHLQVVDKQEPEPGPGQVKIKVAYAAICGTDLHTYEGKYKVAVPVALGHEFSGEITALGAGVAGFQVGDRVTAETTAAVCGECRYCQTKQYNLCSRRQGIGTQVDGAFAEYLVIRAASVHKLPEKVSFLAASMTEAVACAHHIATKAGVQPGDVAVVLGPGPIGLLTAQMARRFGAQVIIAGLAQDKVRLEKAREVGITQAVDIEQQDLRQLVAGATAGYGADIVFECTGAPPSVATGLELLRKQGTYVQAGVFPTAELPADFDKIIQKELRIIGSRSQNPFDWEPSLQLINEGAIKTQELVSHQFTLAEWDKAYAVIKQGQAIKVVLVPGREMEA